MGGGWWGGWARVLFCVHTDSTFTLGTAVAEGEWPTKAPRCLVRRGGTLARSDTGGVRGSRGIAAEFPKSLFNFWSAGLGFEISLGLIMISVAGLPPGAFGPLGHGSESR